MVLIPTPDANERPEEAELFRRLAVRLVESSRDQAHLRWDEPYIELRLGPETGPELEASHGDGFTMVRTPAFEFFGGLTDEEFEIVVTSALAGDLTYVEEVKLGVVTRCWFTAVDGRRLGEHGGGPARWLPNLLHRIAPVRPHRKTHPVRRSV